MFLFWFEDEEDREAVLSNGPWCIMNNLLVLHPLEEGATVTDLDFSKCPFWVQVHGFPVEKMTRTNAESIGRQFGNLLGVEASNDGFLLNRSFLRIRVEVNLELPLSRGFWLRRKTNEEKDCWIWYKYERLADFCYACGRIGNDNKECKFISREVGLASGYGPELKTGRARSPSIPGAPLHLQRKQAEIRVEELLRRRPPIEFQDGGACISNQREEHVTNNGSQNIRTNFVGVRSIRSHDHAGVLEEPGVNNAKNQGTNLIQNSNSLHLSSCSSRVNLDVGHFTPQKPNEPLVHSDPTPIVLTNPLSPIKLPLSLSALKPIHPQNPQKPTTFNIYPQAQPLFDGPNLPITLSPNQTHPTPNPNPSPVPNTNYQTLSSATYYVTEPSDSPKNSSSSPSLKLLFCVPVMKTQPTIVLRLLTQPLPRYHPHPHQIQVSHMSSSLYPLKGKATQT
ncbi:hypothetical protein Vadar_026454 [Vaccinium darrowii]|uniref:Uncharacterized protein n=1 Tax=Vaccinium darrowii TaxID=229202 RepID=A0ACB7YAA5_9ERIC|nr:hypothetical protein Vadar_026454 [Vaccinium darrowii]